MTDYIPPAAEGQAQHPEEKASGMAVTTLVLGILAFCCCGFLTGIPALIIGYMENGKIGRGESPAKGKWMVITGMVLGAISVLLSCLQIIWIFFFGGMSMMQEIMNH